jgi:hypothetical protein
MSGPKVVRIVTREEVVANCQAHLARLDSALARWTKDGLRTDTVSVTEIEAAQARRDKIAALLQTDRFLELQKAAPGEIAFLKADRQNRLEKAALAEARARSAVRRQQDAAASLIKALRRQAIEAPASVEQALTAAADGRGDVAAALSAGFALLSRPAEGGQALRELALRLKDDFSQRTLADWMAAQPPAADEAALARIEGRLAELATYSGEDHVAVFQERFRRLRDGHENARRALLMDSLALDLGQALVQARHLADLQVQLDEALAELAILDAQAAAEIAGRASATSRDSAASQLAHVTQTIDRIKDLQAAEARRSAVLEGLAALGYEVGEGLTTAWVRDGRVVLRRPAQPGYGVEVAGGASAERLQMRVVAFGDEAIDAARDRDAETLWCGDVASLQSRFAAAGAALTIEKAFPVGAVPVKRCVQPENRNAAREGPVRQTRTLK